jgi:hypothetical protein
MKNKTFALPVSLKNCLASAVFKKRVPLYTNHKKRYYYYRYFRSETALIAIFYL